MQRDPSKIEAAPFRLSWPAIFGGMFAAAGVWLLLHAFGLAIGFSQLEPNDANDLRATGIGTGIWTVISSMVALFTGGIVTARAAGYVGLSNAALHGVVVWGVTTVGGLILVVSVIASLARGVSSMTVETMTFRQEDSPSASANSAAANANPYAVRESPTAHAPAQRNLKPAAEMGARAFWAATGVMLLSLVSAVLGAIAGVTRRQREMSAHVAELASPGPSFTTAST